MSTTTSSKPLKVLFHLHPKLDTLDLTGPLEILSSPSLPSSQKAFLPTLTAADPTTITAQNLTITRHIPLSAAYSTLAEYDMLVIPGGGSPGVLEGENEPIGLIKAFAALSSRDGRERWIFSICTGALFLAQAGVLDGKVATTHPNYYGQLREIVGVKGKTEVVEERFVVNKRDGDGLRIITAGGVCSGIDAALWLVQDIVGEGERERTAVIVQYQWRGGEGGEGVVL